MVTKSVFCRDCKIKITIAPNFADVIMTPKDKRPKEFEDGWRCADCSDAYIEKNRIK